MGIIELEKSMSITIFRYKIKINEYVPTLFSHHHRYRNLQ